MSSDINAWWRAGSAFFKKSSNASSLFTLIRSSFFVSIFRFPIIPLIFSGIIKPLGTSMSWGNKPVLTWSGGFTWCNTVLWPWPSDKSFNKTKSLLKIIISGSCLKLFPAGYVSLICKDFMSENNDGYKGRYIVLEGKIITPSNLMSMFGTSCSRYPLTSSGIFAANTLELQIKSIPNIINNLRISSPGSFAIIILPQH